MNVVQAYLKRYASKSEFRRSHAFEEIIIKLSRFDIFQDDQLLKDFYVNTITSPLIQWTIKATRNQEYRNKNNKFITKYFNYLTNHEKANYCITLAIEGDYYYGNLSLVRALSTMFYKDPEYVKYSSKHQPRLFPLLKLCEANPNFARYVEKTTRTTKQSKDGPGHHSHFIFLEELDRIISGEKQLGPRRIGSKYEGKKTPAKYDIRQATIDKFLDFK